jgi:hypothetical protein
VRALYNGMINKRPRLIARCVDAADVITAVNFGRDEGLLIAIRGGGHNGPGLGSCHDGLVIDLSMMKSVRVDPANRSVRRIRHKIANPTEILFCAPPVDRIEGTVPVQNRYRVSGDVQRKLQRVMR